MYVTEPGTSCGSMQAKFASLWALALGPAAECRAPGDHMSTENSNMSENPIAVVGMSCRLPGGVESAADFWELLVRDEDGLVAVPDSRWHRERFYSPEGAAGRGKVLGGGFLNWDVTAFDCDYFGISAREASNMDPQQRLILEVAVEAVENSGHAKDGLRDARTGVFMGGFTMDYAQLQFGGGDAGREEISSHSSTGLVMTMLSNRVSHALDLRGPSMTVDTACSSSLVAVDLACQALHRGDCDAALAGGVNLMLTPNFTIAASQGGMLSPTSQSRPFDAAANGYVRGEGAGMVVLKRLKDAEADGDAIRGVILGSSVTQDGHTNGITVPSQDQQVRAMRTALTRAGCQPKDIAYVEAHGTGTPVGDPIECEAIARVYGRDSGRSKPVVMTSVKANTGHLEAAAGVTGLIKTLLVLQHGVVPPQHNLTDLNPRIDTDAWKLEIPRAPYALGSPGERVLGAVNSFGFGGTNAHVVVGTHVTQTHAKQPAEPCGWMNPVLMLSARSDSSLRAAAGQCADLLEQGVDESAVAGALVHRGPDHIGHRLAVVASPGQAVSQELRAYADGQEAPTLQVGESDLRPHGDVAFVFTGMGPQWWGMGRSMIEQCAVARAAIEEIDSYLEPLAGWSILTELLRDKQASKMGRAAYSQPANFALQVALTRVLDQIGIRPDAIVGHSAGEPAAAWASGALSLADAVTVIYHRARLQDTTAGGGRLAAIGLSEGAVRQLPWVADGRLSIAAVNDESSVALVGPEELLDEVGKSLSGGSIFFAKVPGNVPYHGPLMDPLHDELVASTSGITPMAPRIPIYSTVTGEKVHGTPHDAHYWWENVRHPVKFSSAMKSLVAEGYRTYLEIGPSPVLRTSILAALQAAGAEGAAVATLHRKHPDEASLAAMVAAMYVRGYALDVEQLWPDDIRIPAFQTQWARRPKLWVEAASNRDDRLGLTVDTLLGSRTTSPTPRWLRSVDHSMPVFLADHVVAGVQLMPGSVWAAMCLAAARDAFGVEAAEIADLRFEQGFVFDPDGTGRLVTSLDRAAGTLRIDSAGGPDGPWRRHATARLAPQPLGPVAVVDREPLAGVETWDQERIYEQFRSLGFEYGPAFRLIQNLRCTADRVDAVIDPTSCACTNDQRMAVHPSLVDAAFQLLLPLTEGWNSEGSVVLPVGVDRLVIRPDATSPIGPLRGYAQMRTSTSTAISADVVVVDARDRVILEVCGFAAEKVVPLSAARLGTSWLHELVWPLAPHEARPASGTVGLLCEELPYDLGQALTRAGVNYVVLDPKDLTGPEAVAGLSRLVDLRPLSLTDEAPADASIAASLDQLATIRTLLDWGVHLPLTVVTRRAVAIADDNDQVCLAGASLWGLVRTLRQESASLDARLIDIDSLTESYNTLVQELASPDDEDQIVLRHGERHVGRVQPLPDELPSIPVSLATGGTWLVTGGLGSLGILFTEWLAGHGVTHVVVTSRREAPAPEEWGHMKGPMADVFHRLAALREAGVDIRVERADAAFEQDLQDLVKRVREAGLPEIRGVLHAAGIVDDRTMSNMTDDDLTRVMVPKVHGAWNLHRVLGEQADHMVFFSSISSVLVTAGQGAYAAGNAFMDALAQLRHRQGRRTQSWNWGPWESGMIADLGLQDSFARRGMDLIPEPVGCSLADQMLGSNYPQIAIVSAEWRTLCDSYAVVPMLIQHLAGFEEAQAEEVPVVERYYAETDLGQRLEILAEACADTVAKVLRSEADAIPRRKPLNQQGLDSMIAVELRIRLEKLFGSAPALVFLLQEATIEALARFYDEELSQVSPDGLLVDMDDAELAKLLDEVEGGGQHV